MWCYVRIINWLIDKKVEFSLYFVAMADDTELSELHKLAVDAALSCQWEAALELNKKLLKLETASTVCLNRMAKAYFELGKYSNAKKCYQDTLKLDPYNIIAQKNLKKVSAFKKDDGENRTNGVVMTISPSLFLEEPGTTRSFNLVKVAEPQRLLVLSPGAMVHLVTKNRGVSVTDLNNQYLGALPDDIAHHILRLVKGGNKFQAYVRAIKPNGVTILIKEIFRSKKHKNQASFLEEAKMLTLSDSLPFVSDDSEEAVDESQEEMMG